MAVKHELEIEIDPSGEIHVKVEGAKGKHCLEYVKLFGSIGTVKEQQLTSEYYEPENRTSIFNQARGRLGR